MLAAELGGLSEDFFDHRVVALVPVELRLHHEHRDVLVQSLVVFLKSRVD